MPFSLKTYVCFFPANKAVIFFFRTEMNINILKQAGERHIPIVDKNMLSKEFV